MIIELPYPHKDLWPNGRAHWGAKSKQTKKHRTWAFAAMKEVLPVCFKHNGQRVPIRLTVSAKATGPLPDKDNCLAAAKAYLDGFADALGINDSMFDPQPVHFAGRRSNFVFEVGE